MKFLKRMEADGLIGNAQKAWMILASGIIGLAVAGLVVLKAIGG